MRKKSLAVVALSLLLAGGAMADGLKVRAVLGGGFTFGGDKIAEVEFSDGSSETVKAGGFTQLHGGVELQFTPTVSAQATIGYQSDKASADNGSIKFSRQPFELLGHYRLNDTVRLGGGVRYVKGTKISASGAGLTYVGNESFEPATGTVLEAEFMMSNSVGLKTRYVSEKYESKTYPSLPKLDGSHLGLMMNVYF